MSTPTLLAADAWRVLPAQQAPQPALLDGSELCDAGCLFGPARVVLEYTVDYAEDHRGRDVLIIVERAWVGGVALDAHPDAGIFSKEQYAAWCDAAQCDFDGQEAA